MVSCCDGSLPDTLKLELKDLATRGLSFVVLGAMGKEIGFIHAAHRRAKQVADDLARRGEGWLHDAAQRAQRAVEVDHTMWTAKTKAKGEVAGARRQVS